MSQPPQLTDDDLIARIAARAAVPETRVDQGSTNLPAPATEAELRAAESALGLKLPRFLARLLGEVANGGFGPGYGIVGVPPNGYTDDDMDGSIVDHEQELRSYRSDPQYGMPRGIVGLRNWGCGMFSYVDAESPDARVLTAEGVADGIAIYETASSLQGWMAKWAEGVSLHDDMHEVIGTRMGTNPFTGEPHEFKRTRLRGRRMTAEELQSRR